MTEPDTYLGKLVIARYGGGAGIRAVGKVVSYAGHPTVTIQAVNGEHVHWAAHLCEVLSHEEAVVSVLFPGDRPAGKEAPHE